MASWVIGCASAHAQNLVRIGHMYQCLPFGAKEASGRGNAGRSLTAVRLQGPTLKTTNNSRWWGLESLWNHLGETGALQL